MKKEYALLKTTSLRFILGLSMVAFSAVGWAQEQIRGLPLVKTDASLIRDIDGSNRLVLNMGYEKPYFLWVTDSTSDSISALGLEYQYLSVQDFIVRDDSVFFCGYHITSDKDTQAILGGFPLAGFPNVTVRYSIIKHFHSFERIETYQIETGGQVERHFVTITRKGSDYTLFDIYRVSDGTKVLCTNVALDYFDSDYGTHKIDDLAVTDNYVLVTSHTTSNQKLQSKFSEGRLWRFTRPNTLGYDFFSISLDYHKLPGIGVDRVLLESVPSSSHLVNEYLVAYQDRMKADTISVHRFIGNAYQNTLKLKAGGFLSGLKEMRYNRHNKELDLLVTYGELTAVPLAGDAELMSEADYYVSLPTHGSTFIHVPYPFYGASVSTLSCHLVWEDKLCSFTHLDGGPRFEATGYDKSVHTLQLYSYDYTQWMGCLGMAYKKAIVVKDMSEKKPLDCYPYEYFGWYWIHEMTTSTAAFEIETICNN